MTETSHHSPSPAFRRPETWPTVGRDALALVLVATVISLSVNALRQDGIPLIAHEAYEILVPCPEPMGEAESILPDDGRVASTKTLLIDARDRTEFDDWHLADALNVPFDWLAEQHEIDAQSREVVANVARSRKRDVVVYGDGGDPDSGHHWAALLSNAGIKRVVYVKGGAPALRRTTGPQESDHE